MKKNEQELNAILKTMCDALRSVEYTDRSVGKEFFQHLAILTEVNNICSLIIDKMKKEDMPYLDEVLVILVRDAGVKLTESEILKLITVPTVIYSQEDFIDCIIDSVDAKLQKTTIQRIVKEIESPSEFLDSYLDLLWDNVLEEEDPKLKRKKKIIYEDAKEWFFDKGWI